MRFFYTFRQNVHIFWLIPINENTPLVRGFSFWFVLCYHRIAWLVSALSNNNVMYSDTTTYFISFVANSSDNKTIIAQGGLSTTFIKLISNFSHSKLLNLNSLQPKKISPHFGVCCGYLGNRTQLTRIKRYSQFAKLFHNDLAIILIEK